MLCPLFSPLRPVQGGAASPHTLKGKHIRFSHDEDDEGSDMGSHSSIDSNHVSGDSGGNREACSKGSLALRETH